MSEDKDRRHREKAEREVRETGRTPSGWLFAHLPAWIATVGFLAGLGVLQGGNGGLYIAALSTGLFWGSGIVSGYFEYQGAYRRLLGGSAEKAEVPMQVSPAEAVPSNVADLPPLLDRVEAWLRGQGQEATGERLRAGWDEVLRLARAVAATSEQGASEAELRAEVESLTAQAEAAKGVEARAMWTENAVAASRRLEKLESLAQSLDATRARIESYRQLLKSMAMDLTRLGLADRGELASRGQEVARQVDLLVRTRVELAERGVFELSGPAMSGTSENPNDGAKLAAARNATRIGTG